MERVGAVQWAPRLGDPAANRNRMAELIRRTADQGCRLIVFPECSLTGYMLGSEEVAFALAEPLDGPTVQMLAKLCAERNVYVAVGMLEWLEGVLYNTAVLMGPEGVAGAYRKVHIPAVGADAYVAAGGSFPVFQTELGAVGMLICYDIRFPEAARSLALAGAQAILVLANWPRGAEGNAKLLTPARALENRVYVIAANRWGEEEGITFAGLSRIVGPNGQVLADASTSGDEIVTATVDLSLAGLGPVHVEASGYSVDLRGDRRPDAYHNR